ncbi:dihydroorotase, multifunctional complex type [Bilophila wadsworthia 3_1_6]|uniref:Dihydroorotase, multifunctional complex type n=2 Tax=Bilophila wadsworthia TaxID=35833 RepID=E5Y9Q1_BILW3|nr:dihydroorotase, multifunctional complex type [Bilophila wadsworthia 3_1_6]
MGTTMNMLLKNGRVIDPSCGRDLQTDILIRDGKIAEIGTCDPAQAECILDCTGMIAAPGLIDAHVHLRDPGLSYKASIATDTYAAAKGGVTHVVAMANVIPVPHTVSAHQMIMERMRKEAKVKATQVASLTQSIQSQNIISKELSDIDELVASGVEIFSDDGNCLMDLTVLYKILMKTKEHNMLIMLHEEDEHMKWFEPTAFLHSAESSIVARDLELIRDVGGRRIHFQHISTRRSVELIRQAKADGLSVSSEVCPHHLLLTKAARDIYGTNAKMAPCLQTQDDIEALIEGLEDGTVDIIVSDHAPHTPEDKATELVKAPNGVIGVEVMFPVLLNEFVHKRKFSYSWLLEKLTIKPARLLGLSGGTLNVGEPADVCIFSDREWVIKAENFASISRNTPYDGWEVKGCVEMTLVDGKVVYSSGIIENR